MPPSIIKNASEAGKQIPEVSRYFKCLQSLDTPTKVIQAIEAYSEWATGRIHADLSNPINGYVEGKFPDDFFNGKERYVELSVVLITV
jgi:hypothetical protein